MIICPKCGYREWYWKAGSGHMRKQGRGQMYEEYIRRDDFDMLYPNVNLPFQDQYYQYWEPKKIKGKRSKYVRRRPIGEPPIARMERHRPQVEQLEDWSQPKSLA